MAVSCPFQCLFFKDLADSIVLVLVRALRICLRISSILLGGGIRYDGAALLQQVLLLLKYYLLSFNLLSFFVSSCFFLLVAVQN